MTIITMACNIVLETLEMKCGSDPTASCQEFNLEKWAQPLGDLNVRRAFRIINSRIV